MELHEELKKLTADAIRDEESAKAAKIAEIIDEEAIEAGRGARDVNDKITFLKSAAKNGERRYAVHRMRWAEYDGNFPYNELHYTDITSAYAKGVYNRLKELNLNPKLVHGHDGGGMNSWFTITATW